MEVTGIRYDTQTPVRLELADGRVKRSVEIDAPSNGLPFLAPGLVDIQVNGFDGQEFSSLDLTPEKVATIVRKHDSFGVTAICPTVTTNSFEGMAHGLAMIREAAESRELGRRVAGMHVEGPYFSKEDGPRGAHPVEHCRPPDWDEFQRFQEAAGGLIRVLTFSPEYENSAEFISKVADTGVLVAIGHTGADSTQIRAAVDAGARLSTHLGNGAHRSLRRHPNYIWDQLAEDRLVASLIVDGHHLPGEVVKTFVRAKTPDRCILVSDVSGWAGLPPGRYQGETGELEILPDGRLVIAGQTQLLAGASRPLGVGVAGVMQFAGVDLAEAITMSSTRPAQLIDYQPGGFEPGDLADLVLFNIDATGGRDISEQFQVQATIVSGEVTYGSLS